MCGIDSIKKCFTFHQLPFSIIGLFIAFLIVILLFLSTLFGNIGFANNSLNLRLVGLWNNTYGIFKDIEILEVDDIEGNGEAGMKYAFCVTNLGMVIFDINDINKPDIISFTPIPGCNDIEIEESASNNGYFYAYVAANVGGQGQLKIFDVTDPKDVSFTCEHKTLGNALDVAIAAKDGYAYVADGQNGLTIFDISDTSSPITELQNVGHFRGFAQGVVIEDDYAYVAGSILKILDISNRTNPTVAGTTGAHIFKGGKFSLTIADDYAYAAYWMKNLEDVWDKDLKIIDISNKEYPTIIGRDPNMAGDVAIEGNYMYTYVAGSDGGLKIFDISNRRSPIEIGHFDIPHAAGHIAINGNYAYVVDQHLRIFEISDKSNPNKVETDYEVPGTTEDMVISGNYAYVAYGNTGLLIIDINNQNGPTCIGIYEPDPNGPGFVMGVATEGDYAYVISRSDPNVDLRCSLQVIDISDKSDPHFVGNLGIDGAPRDITIEGGYAYVTFLKKVSTEGILNCPNIAQSNGADSIIGLYIIDIQNPGSPKEISTTTLECIGRPGANRIGGQVAIEGDYAYVISRKSDPNPDLVSCLRIIDISDKNDPHCNPNIDMHSIIQGFAVDFALVGDYVYVTFLKEELNFEEDPNSEMIPSCSNMKQGNERVWIRILRIIDIHNPQSPRIVSPDRRLDFIECGNPNDAFTDIAIKDEYAYMIGLNAPLKIIDISDPMNPDPNIDPSIVPEAAFRNARNVAIADGYMYVTGKDIKLTKLKINRGDSPKGNLILVAGGNNDYESPYWHAIQGLANQVFCTFIENGYETYEIYYHNPVFVQDIDKDGIPNQLVVDNPSPSCVTLKNSIKSAGANTNTGPLYIYLIGHGGEDRFQIMPGEVITASELKMCIDMFQDGYEDANSISHPGTNRQVVVIIESADSGTFIDDLIDDNVTVITSTGEGASYIKPDFSDPNTPYDSFTGAFSYSNTSYNSFTSTFIDTNAFHAAIITNLDPNIIPDDIPSIITNYLAAAFTTARDQLESWALEGPPFANQAPQMALPGNIYTAFYFSEDGNLPISHLLIDQNRPYYLTIIGRNPNSNGLDPNTRFTPIDSQNFKFFSSDQDILNTNRIKEIEIDGTRWYKIVPERNGRIILKGYADPENAPNLLLSAKLIIEVEDPNYLPAKGKIAVIMAGYSGSGDYLWESTNEIGKHAYQILKEMGYTKGEIYYYNPYFLQDVDNNGKYDDIKGYPHLKVLDPNKPDSPFGKIGMAGAKELLLFFVDHGSRDEFNLNPKETFSDDNLVNLLDEIGNQVDERIVFLYDACYSGSFLEKIKKWTDSNPNNPLIDKLITITSTDPNQTAYFLNQGMISFSYPFFDEWFLTHSILDAFDYAERFLLGGQTPQIFDRNLAEEWDRDIIYYTDESRPVIDNVQAYRSKGNLHIEADVYALTRIKEVRAIIGSAKEQFTTSLGRAITDSPVLDLHLDLNHCSSYGGRYIVNIPDPCPNEASYIIFIYAKDNSETRPKIAKYKINLGDMTESRTIALIIASDPNILSYPDLLSNSNMSHEEIQKELSDRIVRARDILKDRGLSEKNPKEIFTVMSRAELDDLYGTGGIFPLAQDQTLFIYLTGYTQLQNDSAYYFYLNPIDGLSPEEFFNYIPQDANQRLLILMDTPYAVQFLENAIAPDKWSESWAGIAGTDQGDLFFPIDPNDKWPFPCFSNFFFSGLLSGATVAEAYRLAEMAVSLTRQGPEIFLPEQDIKDYETINRYLGYYLGASPVPGEEEPLLIHCRALAEEENGQKHYWLSLTPHPDANIIHARAVLTSPTSTLFKKSMAVDLDPNGLIYTADKESGFNYYKALFMVEGRINGDDTGKNRTDWQEVPIVHPSTYITEDDFEPYDNLNIFDPNRHRILINASPEMRTFYCHPDYIPEEGCNDIDRGVFYAIAGQIYEIYAQDLSEYSYFIKLSIYDDNMILHCNPNTMQCSVDNNYLTFACPESGYYLLETKLASSYPSKGVKYILSVCDPQAGHTTAIMGRVVDPNGRGVNSLSVEIEVSGESYSAYTENLVPDSSSSISPEGHFYIPDISFSSRNLSYTLRVLTLEGPDSSSPFEGSFTIPEDCINTLRELTLEGPDFSSQTILFEGSFTIPDNCINYVDFSLFYEPIVLESLPPNLGYISIFDYIYNQRILEILRNFPDPNYISFLGDQDCNFHKDMDYDGDGISNQDEILSCLTHPCFYTVQLKLSKGNNIYHFPGIQDVPNIININTNGSIRDQADLILDTNYTKYYYYNPNSNRWEYNKYEYLKANHFNAIHTSVQGCLYLELKSKKPVLLLKGFLNQDGSLPDTNSADLLFDPDYFEPNASSLRILEKPELRNIQTISVNVKNSMNDDRRWSYRFFGKPAGEDICIEKYEVYIVTKGAGGSKK